MREAERVAHRIAVIDHGTIVAQGSPQELVAPGVIAMTVLFSSVFSGIGLLWDRPFGFLKETLGAPVPRIQIMLGRTLGAATVPCCKNMRGFS